MSVRTLDSLSGPWRGWSIQDGRRITEALDLLFRDGHLSGTGSDADGDFVVEGEYFADGLVELIRRYTFCTAGPEGVGIPYVYSGTWDGTLVSGRWWPLGHRAYGGPFEMWPPEEESAIQFERELATDANRA